MKAHCSASAALALALLATPAFAQDKASAKLIDPDGKEVGTAELTQAPTGVLMKLELTGVPGGVRALHFHTVGKCEPPEFESAEGHFNPTGKEHGLLNPNGPHAGDMPNIHIPEGGKFTVEVLNTFVTLAKGQDNSLLDDDGTAIMIHDGDDDYVSDPTGHAGGRIACGVVQ
jgi:superoxide dismutase, Cu-Zn family